MGSGNRGQLRPHFAGRSPPFLVAALCIGICVLGVSYYSLSTQSSSIEAKLALAIQKNRDITSELETCRSQLHVKEREFDLTKSELEKVQQDLQLSKKSVESKDKEIEEMTSGSEKGKTDLDECRKSIAKLSSDAKNVDDVTSEWKRKEANWMEEKKALEADAERMRGLLKKSAPDEVSNNVEDGSNGKIDEAKGSDAVAKKEPLKAVAAPVGDKNLGSAAAAVPSSVVKAKDEIGVLPEP